MESTLPTVLSPDHLDVLTFLLDKRKKADETLNAYVGEFLSPKYQIGEGDGLRPDGTIQRKAPA